MKYVNFCLAAITSLLLMSSSIKTEKTSTGYYPGERIPNIVLSGLEGQHLDLSEHKGKKVVLSFWAAYDAQSRASNVQLYNYLKENKADVTFLSVSFDENRNVFKRTALLDKIDLKSQFCDETGTDSNIYKEFQLRKGFKNYLIDENGVILAIDLSIEKLKNLI
ncbi:TlpA family protein disulfide reductase [Petrimonas sp.]|uniref:TlpA family protein disulfide reductase n=1 Tax=Petrimonas sp. TaxID=2023866 RepID=UPI003F516977